MEYNQSNQSILHFSTQREPKLLLIKIRKLSLDWQKTVQRKWLRGGGDVWGRMKGTVFILSKLEPGCLCSNLVLALCWRNWIMGHGKVYVSLRSPSSALNIPNSSYKQSLHVSIYIVIKTQSQLMLIAPSSLLLPVSFLKLLVLPVVYKPLASIGL